MKRKLALPILLACLALTSCKKLYTCSCITTEVDTDSSGNKFTSTYKNTTVAYSEKMKEAQAKSACDHEATAIQSNFMAIFTGNGTNPLPSGFSISTACQLN